MSMVSTYPYDVSKQYRSMPFDPTKPFNELPPLPPDGETETRRTLKACVEARAALAELRGAGNLIPNQAILINSIPTLEAQASSEIENIVTTADRLFRCVRIQIEMGSRRARMSLTWPAFHGASGVVLVGSICFPSPVGLTHLMTHTAGTGPRDIERPPTMDNSSSRRKYI